MKKCLNTLLLMEAEVSGRFQFFLFLRLQMILIHVMSKCLSEISWVYSIIRCVSEPAFWLSQPVKRETLSSAIPVQFFLIKCGVYSHGLQLLPTSVLRALQHFRWLICLRYSLWKRTRDKGRERTWNNSLSVPQKNKKWKRKQKNENLTSSPPVPLSIKKKRTKTGCLYTRFHMNRH